MCNQWTHPHIYSMSQRTMNDHTNEDSNDKEKYRPPNGDHITLAAGLVRPIKIYGFFFWFVEFRLSNYHIATAKTTTTVASRNSSTLTPPRANDWNVISMWQIESAFNWALFLWNIVFLSDNTCGFGFSPSPNPPTPNYRRVSVMALLKARRLLALWATRTMRAWLH